MITSSPASINASIRLNRECLPPLVTITFSDRETTKKALGYLAGRFSGRILGSGEVIVPEPALEALVEQGFKFAVLGKATYEQQVAAIRSAPAAPIQRRNRRTG